MKSQDKKSQEKLRTSSKKLNTRKSIKTNLDLIKKNIQVENEKLKEQSRNAGRNTTPLKSKETTANHKSLNDTKASDRRSKRSVKSRKQKLREEIKEETKQTTWSVLSKQPKDIPLKCNECGDSGFKDAKELTKHQHKY